MYFIFFGYVYEGNYENKKDEGIIIPFEHHLFKLKFYFYFLFFLILLIYIN